MKKEKKPSNLQRLMGYAGSYRYLTYISWVLSAVSTILALFPFIFIWRLIREVLQVMPDYSKAQHISFNGWMAVIFALISMLIYIAALFCSHKAAFRVQANLRKEMMHHIMELPIGFTGEYGSGRLRKIVNETSASTETYLAHQLPDKAGAIVTPVALLIMLLVFDWRLGLLSLLPVVGAFLVMSSMTGKEMQRKMKEYQDSLEDMSNEAVEYVRGIPVVKTFGQSVFSFRRFRTAIDNYQKWVISYTKDLRLPMMGYMTMINAVFALLIVGAMIFTRHGVTPEFLLNLLFYIIQFFAYFLLCSSGAKYFVTCISIKFQCHPEFQITVGNAPFVCRSFVTCFPDFFTDLICFLIFSGCNCLLQQFLTFFRFCLSIILGNDWCIHISFSFWYIIF